MFRKRPPHLDHRRLNHLAPRRLHPTLGLVPPLLACCLFASLSDSALAQVSGSVSAVSNYVYRGVSLSDDKPEAQLSLAYDNDSGWFAGLFASKIDLPSSSSLAIAYAGYAHQLSTSVSWEAGATETVYDQASGQNYTEGFVGLTSERLNARIYYSPNYLGQDLHTLYSELNGNYPLADHVRLIGHVGYLARQSGESELLHNRVDTRVGVAGTAGSWNFQVAVVSLRKTTTGYDGYQRISDRHAGLLSVAYGF